MMVNEKEIERRCRETKNERERMLILYTYFLRLHNVQTVQTERKRDIVLCIVRILKCV